MASTKSRAFVSGAPVRPALRFSGWFLLCLAAAGLGRATVLGGGPLALAWPGAGVALLWFLDGDRRTRYVDLAGIAGVGLLTGSVSGQGAATTVVLVGVTLTGVLVTAAWLRHQIPHVWGCGGRAPLERLEDVGQLAFGALLGAGVTALLGTVGLQLVGGADWPDLPLWWARNTVAVVVIGAVGLVASPYAARARAGRGLRAELVRSARRCPAGRVEGIALVAATIDLFWLAFPLADAATFGFLLLALAVWAGARFCPLLVALHGLVVCVAGVALTVAGAGPFAAVQPLADRVVLVQMFLGLAGTTGLVLAFSRQERDLAIARLAAARTDEARADEALRDELMDRVLDEMHRGVLASVREHGIVPELSPLDVVRGPVPVGVRARRVRAQN